MIAKGVGAVRAIMPVALRIASAGVVGAAIGVVMKRAGARLALQDLLLDAWESARAIGELPVWESARRLADLAGAPARDALPALTLLAAAVALALTALRLWRRADEEEAGDAGENLDGAPPRAAFAMPAAVTALSRRLLQDRTARAARTPRTAALVPTLAATGADRAEIARRTGLSRDAVALSLSLSARQG